MPYKTSESESAPDPSIDFYLVRVYYGANIYKLIRLEGQYLMNWSYWSLECVRLISGKFFQSLWHRQLSKEKDAGHQCDATNKKHIVYKTLLRSKFWLWVLVLRKTKVVHKLSGSFPLWRDRPLFEQLMPKTRKLSNRGLLFDGFNEACTWLEFILL